MTGMRNESKITVQVGAKKHQTKSLSIGIEEGNADKGKETG